MKKLLMIIDPQIDFISGSLPVPGAEGAMNALAEYICATSSEYSGIIVTADRHPMRHCSFNTVGGTWPPHCVADSVGAAIWPPLMKKFIEEAAKVTVLHKGEDPMREEYSIFRNAGATERIRCLIKSDNIGRIDICGLAGDVCVADTVRDCVELPGMPQIKILTDFSPSLDDGHTLKNIISNYGLTCDR